MTLKEYVWTFRSKATVSRFDRARFMSTIPTIVKNDLQQNATKQGKYLRVMGEPKLKILSIKPVAPILGLYGHEDVTFEVTTRIQAQSSPAIIITTAMILAIIALIKVAIIATAIVLVFSNVREIATVTGRTIEKVIEKAPEMLPEATKALVSGVAIPFIAIVIVAVLIYMVWR